MRFLYHLANQIDTRYVNQVIRIHRRAYIFIKRRILDAVKFASSRLRGGEKAA